MTAHRRSHARSSRVVRRLAEYLQEAWAAHRRLLENNPAYAATLAAIAATLATQGDAGELLVALIAGVLAVYAAAHQHADTY